MPLPVKRMFLFPLLALIAYLFLTGAARGVYTVTLREEGIRVEKLNHNFDVIHKWLKRAFG